MERYNAYKDSGVPWIGEIPEGWEVHPLKAMFSVSKGLPITKEDLIDDGLPVVSYGQIHSKSNRFTRIDSSLIRYVSDGFLSSNKESLAKNGDFLFADTSEDIEGTGNFVRVHGLGMVFAGYHTLLFKSKTLDDNRFLGYLFQSDEWRSQLRSRVNGVKLFSLTQKILASATILLPEKAEAARVADWLDEKTAEIDGLVGDCEREIELLQEYRKSVISEAVTKGLDPDAPRKDSGVEWIGEIPEEWMVVRIKYFATLESGATPDRSRPEYWGAGYSWFKTGELQNNILENAEEEITDFGFHNSSTKLFPEGTLLIAMYGQGKTRGMTALLAKPSCTNQACAGVSVFDGSVNPRYLQYFMIASYDEIRSVAQGSGQPNLSIDLLKDWSVVRPSINLQQEVVAYLDTKTAEIDTLIEARQSMVEKLKEYRKSIISEAVTGKFKVPEVHAHA